MKLKHAFDVFVDNFTVTYKQLLYRLIILVAAAGISIGVLTPFIVDFINSEALNTLLDNVRTFVHDFLNGEVGELANASDAIVQAYDQLIQLLNTKITEIVLTVLLLLVVLIVEKWFTGLGNYTTAVLINDRMALRTKSSFIRVLVSHFKEAALYNLCYVPLSILYDLIIAAALFFTLFFMLKGIHFFFISLFIFALIMIFAIAIKMTFTCDWLPALIRGKMGQKQSIIYTFSRKNKNTINILSNFAVIILVILAVNVMAFAFTFGVGLLLSLPASYVLIICFEMVNYYDREELRYFLDKNTIVKPNNERALTREQFFKGVIDPDDDQ